MTLKERLARLKEQAEQLMPEVMAGDKVAMAKAAKLADDIEEVQRAVEAADEFESKLRGIGAAGAEKSREAGSPRTIGQFAAAGLKSRNLKDAGRFAVSLGTFNGSKAAASPMVSPSGVASALADVQERL